MLPCLDASLPMNPMHSGVYSSGQTAHARSPPQKQIPHSLAWRAKIVKSRGSWPPLLAADWGRGRGVLAAKTCSNCSDSHMQQFFRPPRREADTQDGGGGEQHGRRGRRRVRRHGSGLAPACPATRLPGPDLSPGQNTCVTHRSTRQARGLAQPVQTMYVPGSASANNVESMPPMGFIHAGSALSSRRSASSRCACRPPTT